MKRNSLTKAFTLVELLVVITIIAILAGAALSMFQTTQMRTRDAKRKSDIKNIATALELLHSDFQRYPKRQENTDLMRACPYANNDPNTGGPCDVGEEIRVVNLSGVKTTYMREIPGDPGAGVYYYRVNDDDTGFQLYAHLENPTDKDCIKGSSGTPDCANPQLPSLGQNACGQNLVCNFGVSSSNMSLSDN